MAQGKRSATHGPSWWIPQPNEIADYLRHILADL